MNIVLGCLFVFALIYLLIQFARHECVQEDYFNAIQDIEGRLDWAHSRSNFPFGMKSQLSQCNQLLKRAKSLWEKNKWHQAYGTALNSQKAMDRAQAIYRSVLKNKPTRHEKS